MSHCYSNADEHGIVVGSVTIYSCDFVCIDLRCSLLIIYQDIHCIQILHTSDASCAIVSGVWWLVVRCGG